MKSAKQPSPDDVGSEAGRNAIFLEAEAWSHGKLRYTAPGKLDDKFELGDHC